MNFLNKYYKTIAAALAVLLLLTAIPMSFLKFGGESVKAIDNASSEDKRIASEISNQTGMDIEQVYKMKRNGRTWNEVLADLKNRYYIGTDNEKSNRDSLLLNSLLWIF